jgi:hypothetical protein
VRGRLLAAALGILVLAALLVRGTGRGAAWAPYPAVPPPRLARPPARLPAPAPTPWAPSRNLFQYGDDRSTASPPPPPMRTPRTQGTLAAPPASVEAPPGVRVVGLIRRAGQLQAALVVEGEMTVVGKGGRAGGYTVLDVDDEAGVRLRTPGGAEMLLPPPPF